MIRWALMVWLVLFTSHAVGSERDFILVQSTTSTQNSGLFDAILPLFEAETGVAVRVVAVGTGQAISNARNGDADVLFVHDKAAEEAFVREGFGLARLDVMYNDFVMIGPVADPANVNAQATATDALTQISDAQAVFVSRGDDSGTHKAERRLWAAAGIVPTGAWYREVGAGMGTTLNITVGMQGYTLSDRATWKAFSNTDGMEVVFEGDNALFNQYGVIAVNPDRHPHVNAEGAAQFVAWLTGSAGQSAIAAFAIEGEQVFFPNAPQPSDG